MKRTIHAPQASKIANKSTELLMEMENHQEINEKISAHKRNLQKYESKKEFLYPLERVVGHAQNHCERNVKYPGADEDYPHVQDALSRFCTKVYPAAKGGPLYVDEPMHEKQMVRAYDRHEKMKKRKIRHIVVEPNSTYHDLMEQLGEL